MPNPTLSEGIVRTHFEDAWAEAEHRRLVEAARLALGIPEPQRKRLPESRVLKRLVASLGYAR